MTTLDEIQQAAEVAKVCPDCARPYAASYPLWQCSDTTCGLSVEWNEDGESHEDCINECLYATRAHLREALAAQTEKAARTEQEAATACARMRAQKADLRARITELEAALSAATARASELERELEECVTVDSALAVQDELQRECEAWRKLAAASSDNARSLEFSLHEAGCHAAEIVDHPGYGYVVASEASYNQASFQAAAIDLAVKLKLIAPDGKGETNG